MDKKDKLLRKISKLYFIEELNYGEIAKKLNISSASVSRFIKKAKDQKVVEITINDPTKSFDKLENELESKYSLKECIIIQNYQKMESSAMELAKALRYLFDRYLKKGKFMGVTGGETLNVIGDHLRYMEKKKANIVPLSGAFGIIESGIYPNAIAQTYARKTGGISYLINTPAIWDSKATREQVERDSSSSYIRSLWNEIDTALFSVTSIDDDNSLLRLGILNRSDISFLRETGAVAEMNFNFLADDGTAIVNDFTERFFTMRLDLIKKVKNRVAVSIGDHKILPLRILLTNKIVNILITNERTAANLL